MPFLALHLSPATNPVTQHRPCCHSPRDLQVSSRYFCRFKHCYVRLHPLAFPDAFAGCRPERCPLSTGKTPVTYCPTFSRCCPAHLWDMKDTGGFMMITRPLVAKDAILLLSETCSSQACVLRSSTYFLHQIRYQRWKSESRSTRSLFKFLRQPWWV